MILHICEIWLNIGCHKMAGGNDDDDDGDQLNLRETTFTRRRGGSLNRSWGRILGPTQLLTSTIHTKPDQTGPDDDDDNADNVIIVILIVIVIDDDDGNDDDAAAVIRNCYS